MSSTFVSLESLHFLLQHMEANRRFEIYQRCPALREFEKSVPLKINSLVFEESFVTVNDTTYKIGIARKCHVGETPRYVAKRNEMGGFAYEVDTYGILDESDALTVTPGDVAMNQSEEDLIAFGPLEEEIRSLENIIQHYEVQLADERERRRNQNLEKIHRLENKIEDSRAKLFDHQCRRHNIPSKYEIFFQLTKSRTVDEKEQEIIERYVHNKKFSEAMKQMTTMFFGGRSSPIHVTRIEFNFGLYGVIRLPIDLKLNIEELLFCADLETSVGVLAPILDELSFPLKKLEIEVWLDEDATNPMVKTAGTLRIGGFFEYTPQTISSITNPIVRISMPTLPEESIGELVENWIESQRPVGYDYIFDFYEGPHCVDEMEEMLKELNAVIIDEENVVIPMSEVTQLKVTYGPFPEFAHRARYAVRFSTETIEH